MTMAAPPPHVAPPAAPAAPAAPPAPGAATGAGPVAALQMAAQKLGAILQAAQAGGGALPANAPAELAAVIQALQGATGGQGAPAPAAAAPPGPPKPPGVPGGPPPGIGKNDVNKELDAYTEMKVTLDAARERMWGISDALREGDTENAKTELKGVITMLSSLKGDAMKATTEVPMTKALFAAWTAKSFEAMKTDDAETANARLATVKRVVALAKFNWEAEGKTSMAPFTVEMETAFAPLPEKTQDLTTKTDQEVDNGTPADTTTGNENTKQDSSFAQNLKDVAKDTQGLLSQFTQQPDGGSIVPFANGSAPAKSPTEKNDPSKPGFVWPMDMNDPNPEVWADDKPATRPSDDPEGWGKDPWSK